MQSIFCSYTWSEKGLLVATTPVPSLHEGHTAPPACSNSKHTIRLSFCRCAALLTSLSHLCQALSPCQRHDSPKHTHRHVVTASFLGQQDRLKKMIKDYRFVNLIPFCFPTAVFIYSLASRCGSKEECQGCQGVHTYSNSLQWWCCYCRQGRRCTPWFCAFCPPPPPPDSVSRRRAGRE